MTSPTFEDDVEIKKEFRRRIYWVIAQKNRDGYTPHYGASVVNGHSLDLIITWEYGKYTDMTMVTLKGERSRIYRGYYGSSPEDWELLGVRQVALPILRKLMVLDDLADV